MGSDGGKGTKEKFHGKESAPGLGAEGRKAARLVQTWLHVFPLQLVLHVTKEWLLLRKQCPINSSALEDTHV